MISFMRLKLIVHFLTLVVLVMFSQPSFSAQDTDVLPHPINTKPTSPQLQYGPTLFKKRGLNEHTLTYALGYWSGKTDNENDTDNSTYLQVNQTNYNRNFTAQEYGVYLTDRSLYGAHIGEKWLFSPGEMWEPFLKGSLAALYKPSEGIGSIINFDRYQIQLVTGFEDILRMKRRVRLEIGAARSNLGFSYFANLGFVIAN
jgi:hypothetical protein